ncbi:hypothetical protein VTK73DRAFT_9308 [Phialemonium thermophilum]|uniref:Major facilitator superfamily (MFS) profile domain-containing protein n=1 Tax=Phialemonium thermophilum TaxID=223376 RepID=A0ABR3W343_9PEZI
MAAESSNIAPEPEKTGQPQEQGASKTADERCREVHVEAGSQMGAVRRRIVMFSLCLALFLSALDITIVATALPTIARHLDADAAEYAWIGSAYTLANTSSVAIWAKLSDIFGRKPIIMLANGAFFAGSLVSGLAATVGMLIGGRVLQGLGAGGCTIMVTIRHRARPGGRLYADHWLAMVL